MRGEPFVKICKVCKVYENGVIALQNVDLVVNRGEFVAIIGPSGSGKSTLLHIMAALDRPTSGEVIIDGVRLRKLASLDEIRLRVAGFVFQSHYLIPTLTAVENVEIALIPSRMPRFARHRRALALLEEVSLDQRAYHFPAQLSGGESQRVAVARALANDPPILLADEPTGELDSATGSVIVRLLAKLNDERRTIVVVTHNPHIAKSAQRVVSLNDGKITADTKNLYGVTTDEPS